MDIPACSYLPRGALQPRGSLPWCADCDTDEHLLVGSVVVLDARKDTLAADINCSRCKSSRVLATTAAFVAAILART